MLLGYIRLVMVKLRNLKVTLLRGRKRLSMNMKQGLRRMPKMNNKLVVSLLSLLLGMSSKLVHLRKVEQLLTQKRDKQHISHNSWANLETI
jgi:hypothetical protein